MLVTFKSFIRQNWLAISVISIIAVIATFIPVIAGYATQGERIFYPISIGSPADTSTYLSWIEQAKEGHFFAMSLYNSDHQSRVFFHPLFFIGGQFGRCFDISNVTVYLILRTIGVVLLSVSSYWFFIHVFSEKSSVILATVLLLFGTSLNPVLFLNSPETWSAEWNIFLSMSQSMLNSFSSGLVLIIFTIFVFYGSGNIKNHASLALLTNLLALIHSYYIGIVFVILGLWTVFLSVRTKELTALKRYSLMVLLTFPSILFVVYVLNANTLLGIWAFIQSNVPSGFSFWYAIGYPLVILFCFCGLFFIKDKSNKAYVFAIIWMVSTTIILIMPFQRFDRKIIQGLQVPIIYFLVLGISWFLENYSVIFRRSRKVILVLIASTFILPNILLLLRDVKIYAHNPSFTLSVNFLDGTNWLKDNADNGYAILSGYRTSNLIPGLTGRQVFFGHYDQTINNLEKYTIAQKVLMSVTETGDPLKFSLRQENIGYIFVDEEIHSWGGLDVINRPYLKLVYENPDVQIYEVDQAKLDE